TGRPPPREACRAGFMRLPAWMTLPITTVPISSASRPARRSVSRTAIAPSSVAGVAFKDPLKPPIAVRTGWARTMSRVLMGISSVRRLALGGGFDGRSEHGAALVRHTLRRLADQVAHGDGLVALV